MQTISQCRHSQVEEGGERKREMKKEKKKWWRGVADEGVAQKESEKEGE